MTFDAAARLSTYEQDDVDITISLDGFVAAPGDDVTRLGPQPIELERGRVIDSPAVTHLRYRVLR
jgi:hypothetical protein